jgi:hypothetical protein
LTTKPAFLCILLRLSAVDNHSVTGFLWNLQEHPPGMGHAESPGLGVFGLTLSYSDTGDY